MQSSRERLSVTISRSLKERLEAAVPDRQRSAFTEQALEAALRARARQEALEMLDALPSYPTEGVPSEDVLRRYREDFDRSGRE